MGNDVTPLKKDNDDLGRPQPFAIEPDPILSLALEEKKETAPEIALATLFETVSEPATSASYEDLGELPVFYQTGNVYLAARDPHWLFVYWDINLENVDRKAMLEDEANIYLKVFKTGGDLIDQIRVNLQAKNWYFPIKEAGVSYYVELGFYDIASKWAVVGKSNEALAPSDSFTEGPVEFASIPFHLSFDRMLKIVQDDLAAGTSLVGALSRLQNSNDKTISQIAEAWSDEQKRLLEELVGAELVSQISLGSAEVDQIFRQRLSQALSESLSSPLSSDSLFLKSLVATPGGESSLFSGIGASWSSAAGGEASWAAALGGGASWSRALGSSWSAQPFGSAEREFFMHVNAEVIFYGGTHPDATVWIDGKEIALAKDGSFRYHFRLPDGEFEIPIVAESPDGVEVRSAKLVFKRGTTRTGEVGSTKQPEYLNAPMGSR